MTFIMTSSAFSLSTFNRLCCELAEKHFFGAAFKRNYTIAKHIIFSAYRKDRNSSIDSDVVDLDIIRLHVGFWFDYGCKAKPS